MEEMRFYTEEEVLNKFIGKPGSAEREAFEQAAEADIQAWRLGEAIKQARQAKHLTQEQLAERIGVKRAQVSRIEKGRNLTFNTLSRIFRALDVPVSLDVTGIGKVALW